jgi:hypothetical protein
VAGVHQRFISYRLDLDATARTTRYPGPTWARSPRSASGTRSPPARPR